MTVRLALSALAASLVLQSTSAQYTATYTPETAPEKSEQGQTGTNQCGTGSSQDSDCQNAYINSVTDFCLWAPPSTTSDYGDSAIGNTERIEVAWCTQPGRGTRVIPAGAITGAHFVQTEHYVQITGVGDLTKLNIPAGDDGGELDPHGADGLGNPIGGLVFSEAFGGGEQQVHEWTNFMSSNAFSFRACTGDQAAEYCQHIYDVMGAGWNAPGSYDAGSFDQCEGDAVEPVGVYGTSTFHQGDASTPAAHPAGATSQCTTFSTVGGGVTANAMLPTKSAVSDGSSSAVVSASVRSASGSGPSASSSASSSLASSTSVASSSSSIASSSSASSSAASSSSSSSVASSSSSFSSSRVSSSTSSAASAAAQTSNTPTSGALVGSSSISGWGLVSAGLVVVLGSLVL